MPQLTSEVAEFAKQFNIPLKEATEGLYQTLSNQFTAMSQRTDIMTASMKLAKVGVMDFHDAILLVTGTLNAYGLSSDQAESVAAKFFTTIQLGRVRGQELAAVMGQVTPIASELGIGLEQLNSAMVGLTIGGLDAHKAATGLRGAMMALLKPSEDMQKVIRELGYASGEQMVQAKGFQGALQAVADAADNMGSKIAKDVPNVRALTAELRLTQTGAKQVEDAMKAMALSTPETLDKVYKQFTSTDSEKLTSTINKLKIDLTQDFGAGLTHALASLMQLVGGADNLSAAIQALVPVAATAAAGLIALGGCRRRDAYRPGAGRLGAHGRCGCRSGGNGRHELLHGTVDQRDPPALQRADPGQPTLPAEQGRGTAHGPRDGGEEDGRREPWLAGAGGGDPAELLQGPGRPEGQEQAAHRQRPGGHAVDARLAGAGRGRLPQRRQRRAQDRARLGEAARRYVRAPPTTCCSRGGSTRACKPPMQFKMQMDLQRATELRDAANTKLATATTAADVGRADALRQRADAFEKEGVALAKELGDTFQIEQAEKRVISNVQDQIAAEKQAGDAASQAGANPGGHGRQGAAAARHDEDPDEGDPGRPGRLRQEGGEVAAGVGRSATAAHREPRQVQGPVDGRPKGRCRRSVGLRPASAPRERGPGGRRLQSPGETNSSRSPETFAKFREEISKGVGPVQIAVTMARVGGGEASWKATAGMTASETMAHYEQELQRTTQIINSFKASQDALKVANDGVQQSQGQVQSALDRWVSVGFVKDVRDLGGIWEQFTGHVASTPVVKQAREELVRATLKFTAPNAQPLKEDLDKLQAAYDLYLAVLKPGAASKTALDEFMKKASGMVSVAQQVQTIAAGLKANEANVNAATQEQSAIQNALKAAADAAAKAKQSTDATQTGAEAASKALSQVSQINMSALLGQTQQLADAMWNLAQASQNVVQAPAARMTAAQGGVAWKFLAGGGPVGTDVIPAMLSPGEVVINAASARNFASQLTAINAGVRPVYRSEGGSVTNIGDINVSVTGGGTGRQTARSIAAELRRELRRGTATL